jgi:hypothetical protein
MNLRPVANRGLSVCSHLGLAAALICLVGVVCLAAGTPDQASGSMPHYEISPNPWQETGASPTTGLAVGPFAPHGFVPAASGGPNLVYSHGDPTPQEQYMLELVNRARLNPSGEAARYGIDLNEGLSPNTISATLKQPLAFNSHLLQSARVHSQWMLDNNTFSHYGAGGNSPGDRMQAAGYVFSGTWTYGENIAWRGTTGVLNLDQSVANSHQDLFVDQGISDRGHRVNLMKEAFCEVGVGVRSGVYVIDTQDYNSGMITQDFGKTGADPAAFVLGVVYRDTDGNGFYTPGEGLAGVTVTPASGTYYALTSTSGGYAIPLAVSSGAMQVTISGGSIPVPITKSVTLTGQNVKLDFDTTKDKPSATEIRLSNPRFLPNGHFTFSVTGNVGQPVTVFSTVDFTHWTNLGTSTASDFTDPNPATSPGRFYRGLTSP